MRCRTAKQRHSFRILAAALEAWRSLTTQELHLRHFHLRRKERLGCSVAAAWAREASEGAGLRRRRAQMERRQSIRVISMTMKKWVQFSRASACIRRKTHRHEAQMLELTLSAWRTRCSEILWRRTRLDQRKERQQLVQAFACWHHVLKVQNTLSLTWKTRGSALTRQSWLVWQLWACERMLGRQKLRGRAALRALGSAWRLWNWMLEAQNWLRMRWQCRDWDLLGSTFGHWRRCFAEGRAFEVRLTEQARQRSKQLLWDTWQQHLQNTASLKVKVCVLHARWLLRHEFHLWHHWARMGQKASLLHAAAQLRLCRNVLWQWQASSKLETPVSEHSEVPRESNLRELTGIAEFALARGAEGLSTVTEESPQRVADAVGACDGGAGTQEEHQLRDTATAALDEIRYATPEKRQDDAASSDSEQQQSLGDDLQSSHANISSGGGGSISSSPSRRQQQERRKRSSSPTSPELAQLPPSRSSPTSPGHVQLPSLPSSPLRPLLPSASGKASAALACRGAEATPSPSPRPEDRARVAASASPLRRSWPSRSPSPLVAIPSPARSSPHSTAGRPCSPAAQRSGPQVLPWAGSSQICYFQPAPAWSLQGGEVEVKAAAAAEADPSSAALTLSKALSAWRSFCGLRRRGSKLSRHSSCRAGQRALVALHGLARARRCRKKGLLGSTLARLRSAVEICRAQRTVLQQLLSESGRPGRELVELAWAALLSVHAAWQEAQRVSAERRRHASLAGPCIWSWAQLTVSARADREALRAKWSQSLVVRCLQGWKTGIQLAASARVDCIALGGRRSRRVTSSCLRGWQTLAKLVLSARADGEARSAKCSRNIALRCLQAWQSGLQLALFARADGEARNAKCSRRLALCCMQAWQSLLRLLGAARADCETRRCNRSRSLTSCCVRAWQSWLQLFASLSAHSDRRCSRSRALRCVQGWHGWLCAVRHAAKRLHTLGTQMVQAKVWDAWLALSRSLVAPGPSPSSQRRLGSLGRRAALRRWASTAAARRDRRARHRTPPPREEEPQLTPVKEDVPDRALRGAQATNMLAAKVALEEDFVQQRMRQVKLLVADARIRGTRMARTTRNVLRAWRQLRAAELMARRRTLRCSLQELRNLLLATAHDTESHSQARLQKRLRASLVSWHGRSSSRGAAERAHRQQQLRCQSGCLAALAGLLRRKRQARSAECMVLGLRAHRALADWALVREVRLRVSVHSEQQSLQLRQLAWYWLSGFSVPVLELMQAWCHVAKDLCQERLELQQLQLANAALKPRFLKRSLAAWARRATLRRPRLAVVARQRSSRQSTVLASWLKASRRQRTGRVLTSAAERRQLRRAMDAWAVALSLRRRLDSGLAQRRTLLLRLAMDHWLVLQGRQRAGSEVQGRVLRWRIRKVLRRWSLARQAQSRAAVRGRSARAALQAAGLAAWRLAASSCVFRRRALRLTVRLWRAGVAAAAHWLLQKAWSAWRRERRQSTGGQRLVKAAFRAWHEPVQLARQGRMRNALASWRATQAAQILERRLLAFCVWAMQEMVNSAAAVATAATMLRYLTAWRMVCADGRAWQRKALHAFRAWRCGLQVQQALGLQRCLRIWREIASDREPTVAALDAWRAATLQLRAQALQRSLQRWRLGASMAAAVRREVGLVLQAWKDAVAATCNKVTQRHLRLWNGLAAASVAARRCSRALLQAWQASVSASFKRNLRQRLQLWRECSTRHLAARSMMLVWSKLASEASSRALRRRLQLWNLEAARGRLVRATFQVWRCSVAESHAERLQRSWNLWSGFASCQARHREIMKEWHTTTIHARSRRLRCRMKLWSAAALRQKLARNVTCLWHFVVAVARRWFLRRCLRLWSGCVFSSMTSRAITKEALSVWRLSAISARMQFLRVCLHTWRGITVEKDDSRSWAHFAFTEWRSFTIMQALRFWLRMWRAVLVQVSSFRDVSRQLLVEWARVTAEGRVLFTRRCLHLWRGNAAATQASRCLASQLLLHWKSCTDVARARSQRCWLHVWQGAAAAVRFVREVAKGLLLHWHASTALARTRSLHRCFCSWRGSAAAASMDRAVAGQLLVQWKFSTVEALAKCQRRALFLWRGSAATSQAHRAIARDLLLRWKADATLALDQRLRNTLRTWRVKVDASIALNSAAKTCLHGWQLHTSAASAHKFRQWLHWWRCVVRMRSVWRDCVGLAIYEWQGFLRHCQQQRLVGAWRRWSCFKACEARHRRLQGDVFCYWQRALLVARRALLRRSHGLWRQSARLAAQERCLLLFTVGVLFERVQATRQARLRLATTSWRASRALLRADRALAAAVFECWRASVEDRKTMEDELRHFWWCCERSNVLAAERLALACALAFRSWASCVRQQLARRRRCEVAVQAARIWPLRTAFAAFRAGLAALGKQRHAALLAAGLQRCLWRGGCDLQRALDWQRHKAVRVSLQAWQFLLATRKRFQAAILILHQMPLAWGFARLLRTRGSAQSQLQVLGGELLRSWRTAARKSLLSHWLLRWRAGTAVTLGSRRLSCRRPLQRWHARAAGLRVMREREVLARRYAARRLLQRVLGTWAMSKHCGQLRVSPLLAAPVLQSSWCNNVRRTRPDGLALWSSALRVAASCH
eukprot:TRINITY_DN3026_c0_g1_i2.p1 TRINITY_DN3026_c0_g1~~TRINITY_DN3026_c0_g1_i2.p1  ORF type:complete len:2720 (+),score=403.04 TRINITY_DN3026_c0_g1_i2:343-8160(+)